MITCGPTWVPIDDTRVISNISTGKLGQVLATALTKRKAHVTLLEGPVWEPLRASSLNPNLALYLKQHRYAYHKMLHGKAGFNPDKRGQISARFDQSALRADFAIAKSGLKIIKFKFYDDFYRQLTRILKKTRFDIIFHAAAVSDYKLKNPFPRKLSSHLKKLRLDLTPTKKIINIFKYMQPQSYLVGFKLMSMINQKKAKQSARYLFQEAGCDLVVANALKDNQYEGYILNKRSEFLAHANTRAKIVQSLIRFLGTKL